jgi:hypothetical protein
MAGILRKFENGSRDVACHYETEPGESWQLHLHQTQQCLPTPLAILYHFFLLPGLIFPGRLGASFDFYMTTFTLHKGKATDTSMIAED